MQSFAPKKAVRKVIATKVTSNKAEPVKRQTKQKELKITTILNISRRVSITGTKDKLKVDIHTARGRFSSEEYTQQCSILEIGPQLKRFSLNERAIILDSVSHIQCILRSIER